MNEQKSLITHLAEAYDRYRAERPTAPRQQMSSGHDGWLRWLGRQMVPNIGTLLVVVGLLWASNVGALPLRIPSAAGTSTGTIAYQGRLADSDGNPVTDTVNMEFRLYDVAEAGTPLWSELWTGSNAVRVSDGLFNVMLGSLEPIPQAVVAGQDQLWLGITVSTDDEMRPRVQLGSVPFAVQALTVPDGSITQAKAPSLVGSVALNTQMQSGAVRVTATEDTNELSVYIDFVPDFSSRPVLVLQPHWDYTAYVIATIHGGCNGDKCQVFIRRTDSGTWFAGQFQSLDWVAVGQN